MKFPVPVALALVVGILGVVISFVYLDLLSDLGLLVPITFLGAASYYAAGGTTAALLPSAAANIWGVVCGVVTLYLLGETTNTFVLSLIIGGMTAVFILGALVDVLGFVPGTVIGFASTVLFGLLAGLSATDFALPEGPFTVMAISILVGNLYGWVSSLIVPALVAAEEQTVSG